MLPFIEIYTDGSCDKSRHGGWSFLIAIPTDSLVRYGGSFDTTNNKMELTAVIEALNALITPCSVRIISDSKYVVNGITSWVDKWKNNNWLKVNQEPISNLDLWKEIDRLKQIHQVTMCWVKAHTNKLTTSDSQGNNVVDHFANNGRLEIKENVL